MISGNLNMESTMVANVDSIPVMAPVITATDEYFVVIITTKIANEAMTDNTNKKIKVTIIRLIKLKKSFLLQQPISNLLKQRIYIT